MVSKIIETERIQTVITLNKKDQPLKNNETVTLTLQYAGQKVELMMKKMKKTVIDALNNPIPSTVPFIVLLLQFF